MPVTTKVREDDIVTSDVTLATKVGHCQLCAEREEQLEKQWRNPYPALRCPACGSRRLRRSLVQRGFKDYIYFVLGFLPYRCSCGGRFYAMRWLPGMSLKDSSRREPMQKAF